MIIIILVCIGFGTSFHLTNAYGMTGLSASRVKLIGSCIGDGSYNNFAFDSNVCCLGFHFYNPSCLPPILWSRRWCILGLYFSILSFTNFDSNLEKVPSRSLVPVYSRYHHGQFHVILEMGNVQEAQL